MTPTVSTEVQTVTASNAMPALLTGTTDFLLQNPENRCGVPTLRMTGAVPPLPVVRRGADIENITFNFTRESEVKIHCNGRRTSRNTAIRR